MFFDLRPIRHRPEILRAFLSAGMLVSTLLVPADSAVAQQGTPIHIDASRAFREAHAARYDEKFASTPTGATLGVNSRYLMRDGKPWLPVMGEFHFSRYPRAEWEEELLKMKAAGVDTVATYVIWIHHEEIASQFDWKGQRDLRAFAELCARHNMYLVVRIGPWDHAEVRNGGLPDWVVQQGPTRINDPHYMASAASWFGQIGRQLHGLMWKDGGPVIGIQLENEYAKRGSGAGAAHILALKKLAIEAGLEVPLYTETAWDNAVIPARAVLPVYGGGYPDQPWDRSLDKLPPAEVYAFRFHSRVSANASAASEGAANTADSGLDDLPYLTAEIGGGNEITYHRRPVIHPDDIAAMFPVMLGSGVNLYGTYMFQGGENPDGKLTTLQESQQTGYPNDLPIKSYDFQAPLSEFGEERASFRKIKVFQYFLNDFGSALAPMVVHPAEPEPASPVDLSAARASVRSSGNSGFIFFNNHVRGYTLPARPGAQFLVRLPSGTLAVPRHPVDLPSNSYFIWPFNLSCSGVTLRYSTAQLFTRLDNNRESTFYFEALPGIPVELAFDAATVRSIEASSGSKTTDSGVIYLDGLKPGAESFIDVATAAGETVHFVVLTAEQAENAWKVRLGGSHHLLITAQDFFAEPDGAAPRLVLRSLGGPHFEFTVTPPLTVRLQSSLRLAQKTTESSISRFEADAGVRAVTIETRQVQVAGDVPPIKLAPPIAGYTKAVAQAPAETELAQAGKWSITVRSGAMDGLSDLFLEIGYTGDVARLYAGKRLLTDDYYRGQPWSVGLGRFLEPHGANLFELSILPLRADAPVYLETAGRKGLPASGQSGTLESIRVVPEYQLVLAANDAAVSGVASDRNSANEHLSKGGH